MLKSQRDKLKAENLKRETERVKWQKKEKARLKKEAEKNE